MLECIDCGVRTQRTFRGKCLRCATPDLEKARELLAANLERQVGSLDGTVWELEEFLPSREAVKLLNNLEAHAITTVRQLAQRQPQDLLALPNMDRRGLTQLIEGLRAHRARWGW